MADVEGRGRVIIEGVQPEIDCGRFPIKRVLGDSVVVEADIYADGHDVVNAVLLHRRGPDSQWTETPMDYLVNDRWRGSFLVAALGDFTYTIKGWIDRFKTWRRDMVKRVDAGQVDLGCELEVGADLISQAAERAAGNERSLMERWAESLRSPVASANDRSRLAIGADVAALVNRYPSRDFAFIYPRELTVRVDRQKALFSTWYEMFPRSCAPEPGKPGTFRDCEARLPYIAEMGFDVLYMPPVHPIGRTARKGRNNTMPAGPDDPGTPWAIGADQGGHKAIHPELGSLEDFHRLMSAARGAGIEIAMDLAFQCSPDHPWVREHPEWFLHRPDGTIQYAENPPKKYEDIYPLNFDTEHWRDLWEELRSAVFYWMGQGIRIFRVDNPHTKPFRFWEWLIGEARQDNPDVIFLAEAFTRPKVMYMLAKAGFTQSYTYFAWRNARWELVQYLTELTRTSVREYFRPNLWPNTPDILTEYLQYGGRPAFMARLVLAATLSASYGIYGPPFELCEGAAREAGSEEYYNSEKYQVTHWDLGRADSLRYYIGRVNQIRRENPALHNNRSLRFYNVDNEQIICYSKNDDELTNVIVAVVNLDPRHTQAGWVDLDIGALGVSGERPYQVHELLTGAHHLWTGRRNFVQLDPRDTPAEVYRIRRYSRTEHDFDYYM